TWTFGNRSSISPTALKFSDQCPTCSATNVVFGCFANTRSRASRISFSAGKSRPVERPVRMRAELLVAFVEAIDREKEGFGIAHVHRDRKSEAAAGVPHRIESGIVDFDQRPLRTAIAKVETEGLHDLQPDGAA